MSRLWLPCTSPGQWRQICEDQRRLGFYRHFKNKWPCLVAGDFRAGLAGWETEARSLDWKWTENGAGPKRTKSLGTVGMKYRTSPHCQPLVSPHPPPLQPFSSLTGVTGPCLGRGQHYHSDAEQNTALDDSEGPSHTMVRLVSMTTLKGLLFIYSGSRVGDAGSGGQSTQVPEV